MSAAAAPQFSISRGGRIHDAMVRFGLPESPRGMLLRLAILVVVGWLPLVLLAAGDGLVFGRSALALFGDFGPWVRFFFVAPVMILAEPVADRVLDSVVRLIGLSGLVPAERQDAFDRLVTRTQRAATSDTADLLMLVLALVVPHILTASISRQVGQGTAWIGSVENGMLTLTAAGRWYTWVSLPVIEFLLLRWLWRSLAWWWFLWRVARLPLDVVAAHPDRAGGLGFLAYAPNAFLPVFVALSALGAVGIAADIRINGSHLAEVKGVIIALIVLEIVILIVPQLFFLPLLSRTKRDALMRYGVAGARMARRFERQWTHAPLKVEEELIDSSHPSAMIDYAGTYQVVESLRPTIFSLRELVRLLLPIAAPFAPLLLFEYSVKDILARVMQLVR